MAQQRYTSSSPHASAEYSFSDYSCRSSDWKGRSEPRNPDSNSLSPVTKMQRYQKKGESPIPDSQSQRSGSFFSSGVAAVLPSRTTTIGTSRGRGQSAMSEC